MYLSCQLSEVNFIQHENSAQQKGVFSGIVDNLQGMDYSLSTVMQVDAGPELSSMGISSQYLRD
jgi:hypothetical protein